MDSRLGRSNIPSRTPSTSASCIKAVTLMKTGANVSIRYSFVIIVPIWLARSQQRAKRLLPKGLLPKRRTRRFRLPLAPAKSKARKLSTPLEVAPARPKMAESKRLILPVASSGVKDGKAAKAVAKETDTETGDIGGGADEDLVGEDNDDEDWIDDDMLLGVFEPKWDFGKDSDDGDKREEDLAEHHAEKKVLKDFFLEEEDQDDAFFGTWEPKWSFANDVCTEN
ncbi:hypothetical protein BT63DRAFT_232951 [Microthyrium microscopicum]|uniref:Uncharacterized protein n=1 Tax=Microthyrium microscopicum TaxID=703497 RepID=A0A6A6UFN0_9PEZI|nr:hypothetical protein BT63DRAFT_232951 [Microthyrium microscopicum]